MQQRKQKPKLTLRELRNKRDALRNDEAVALGVTLPRLPPRLLPPPDTLPPQEVPEALPSVLLGHFLATGKPFGIEIEDLVGGLWILGKNGSGKTITIERLATSDMEAGRGCIVLDPAGDLTENLIARVPEHRLDDVILLDAGDKEFLFGVNPVWSPHSTDLDEVSAQSLRVRDAFKKVTSGWGAGMNDVIPNAAHVLLANPGHSLADFRRLFQDAEFRRPLLARVQHPDVRDFWTEEYDQLSDAQQRRLVDSTLSRVRDFLRDSRLYAMLSQSPQTVDFSRWINERKIVLIKFPPKGLPKDSLALLGALILQQVKEAAWAQVNLTERNRPLVPFYVDEFPRFATPEFGEMFRELRKSGVVTVLAHQDLAQLPDDLSAIPKAARHFFCFSLTGEDAPYAVREFHPEREKRNLPVSLTPVRDTPHRHSDPEAVRLAHQLEELIQEAIVVGEAAIRREGRIPNTSAFRLHRTEVENALNRYLVAAMQGEDREDIHGQAYRELWLASLSLFSGKTRDKFINAAEGLGEILADEPVYASSHDPMQTAEEAKRALQARLTGFNVFECYCKVERGRQVTEQFVRMEPLPWVTPTAEVARKRERIRHNMVAQGIVRPRSNNPEKSRLETRTASHDVTEPVPASPAKKRPAKTRIED